MTDMLTEAKTQLKELATALIVERNLLIDRVSEIDELLTPLEAVVPEAFEDDAEVQEQPEPADDSSTPNLGPARGRLSNAEKDLALEMCDGVPTDLTLPNGRRITADQIIEFKKERG